MEKVYLLFLDIDGVLNGHERFKNRWSGIDRERVEILNVILDWVPNLQIVLSSAWRYRFSDPYVVEGLLCCHGMDCFERVHGITEQDPQPENAPPYDDVEWWNARGLEWRALQIKAYVMLNPCEKWAVIDDLPLKVDNLFQTDPKVGITHELAESIVRFFTD